MSLIQFSKSSFFFAFHNNEKKKFELNNNTESAGYCILNIDRSIWTLIANLWIYLNSQFLSSWQWILEAIFQNRQINFPMEKTLNTLTYGLSCDVDGIHCVNSHFANVIFMVFNHNIFAYGFSFIHLTFYWFRFWFFVRWTHFNMHKSWKIMKRNRMYLH